MRKSTNLNILYSSILLTILIAYVTPCRYIEDWRKMFGLPFGWFTVYYDRVGDVILTSTGVNLFPFLTDVFILYLVISGVHKLYWKKKST